MRKTKMPLAYSYRRWSSPEQGAGRSNDRQTEAAEAYCRRNNLLLDATLNMTDAGVSAFKGGNLQNPDVHALAGFHRAVKSGRVPRGSYLVVESFDRLSRDHWKQAIRPILDLLDSGIKIVQLVPEQVLDEHSDEWAAMALLFTLARGRNESVVKSGRIGDAWAAKRRDAATKVVTRKLPGWIRCVDGRLVLDQRGAETVRRVFALARDGNGVALIAKTLNAEGVPVLGRTEFRGRPVVWSETVVYHLLKSPAVIGEFHPHKGVKGNARLGRAKTSKPEGKPIRDYYPRVVTDELYHAVQTALKSRTKNGSGRRGSHVNLFSGLLFDARDGGSLTYKHHSTRAAVLIPVGAKHGRGTPWSSYPAAPFEDAVLRRLSEVKVSDVEGTNAAATRVEALASQIAEVESLIGQWAAKMDNPLLVDRVAAKLAELEARHKKLSAEQAEAQRDASSSFAESWGEFRSLADRLAKDKSDDLRTRVRAALRRVVKGVWCYIRPGHGTRVVYAQVWFTREPGHRDYIIRYTAGRTGIAPPPEVSCWKEEAVPEGLDLRKTDHVVKFTRALNCIAAGKSPEEKDLLDSRWDRPAAGKPAKAVGRGSESAAKKVTATKRKPA